MPVLVDSREPRKVKDFLKAGGIDFEIRQMETGDVLCWNQTEPEVQVLIERKRLDDLISSYYSKRMGEQFQRMSEEKFAILVITGNLQDVLDKLPPKVKVMPLIIEEIIAMAVIRYNFRSVIWMVDGVNDVHQSGFLTVVKCIQKVVDGQLDAIPQKKVKLSKDLRVNTLRQMFGLDAATSKNLLKKYGTVRSVLRLTDVDLLKVKGMGPAKIKTIRYILDENINKENYKIETSNKICTKCKREMSIVKMPGGNTFMCKHCIGDIGSV